MNPNSFNTVINLETDLVDGEMTEEHRQLIEKAVNRYSKEYYVDPKMSGVKFEGFILVDRSQISKGMYRNQIFRLAGQGMVKKNMEFGDLFVRIDVQIPEKMTDEQIELFNKIRNINDDGDKV